MFLVRLLNNFIAAFRLLLILISMAGYFSWFLIRRSLKDDKLAYGLLIQQRYARLALRIFNTHVTVEGEPISGPALYVSNHRSLLDPIIIHSRIKAMSLAKAEIANYPILGPAVKSTGIIFVDRGNKNSRAEAKDAIVVNLEAGNSVVVYPEGTVSGEITTLPFHKGSFEKAIEANVPVVPITLIYNHSKFHWYHMSTLTYYFKSFGWNTADVHMVIGQPIWSKSALGLANQSQEVINNTLLTHSAISK
jgi:1-acyl-sn-glycerol-3-phosphate acyltransferase